MNKADRLRKNGDHYFFSIVTVCRNNKVGLIHTWESIISQEWSDWEWIVVDGNSDDGTQLFLDEVTDPRITYISEPDDGLYDAMNKGIELSSGQYILFLNSGDQLHNTNVLSLIQSVAEKNDYPGFLYGDSFEITPLENLLYKKARSHKTFWYGMFTHHQSMIYKTSNIRDIRYRHEYPIGADYAFTVELLNSGTATSYIPYSICIFEQGGLSSTNHKQGEEDQWNIRKDILRLPWIFRFLIKLLHVLIFQFKKSLPKYYEKVRFTYGK